MLSSVNGVLIMTIKIKEKTTAMEIANGIVLLGFLRMITVCLNE